MQEQINDEGSPKKRSKPRVPGRRIPVQARGKATVEKIRKASLDILGEEGLEALNTNAIAERAGINISTLYSYYPDKYTILYDLFEVFEETRSHFVILKMQELAGRASWREWFSQVIDGLAAYRLEDPAGIALRRALVLRPELHELDIQSSKLASESLANTLVQRFSLDMRTAEKISETAIESITHMLDSAFHRSPPNLDKVEELKLLVTRYLSPYLEDEGVSQ
ncbi:TetR/AcrR family transcriptional regulator [Marinobacter sp.]|uniref:TetR/AcrR family transcriptional regulator n=1 Tax=Marinobacter sp. TaxID=50741 RepID=UPI003A8F4AFE